MANRKLLRLLLIEADPDEEELICEALIEIDEGSLWRNWHACELVQAGTLAEALERLRRSTFDVVLLDLELPGTGAWLDAFQAIQAAAPGTAILVLAGEEQKDLATRLLHEGAQDVLIKAAIECEPLARAIRHAVERQRRLHAIQSAGIFDDLTGLYNARGFAVLAQHDFEIAARTGYPFTLAIVELTGLPEQPSLIQRDDRDMLVLRAGELLRSLFGASALVARLGPCRFGILSITVSESGAERLGDRFESEMRSLWGHHARFPVAVRTGAATFYPESCAGVEDLLEEAEHRMTRHVVHSGPLERTLAVGKSIMLAN